MRCQVPNNFPSITGIISVVYLLMVHFFSVELCHHLVILSYQFEFAEKKMQNFSKIYLFSDKVLTSFEAHYRGESAYFFIHFFKARKADQCIFIYIVIEKLPSDSEG